MNAPSPLPYTTPGLAGCGGRIKATPEDFRVEEIPLYPLSGHGEHLYLEIEKRGIPTATVIQELARALGVPLRGIGHAGLKDAQALATQWLSLHCRADPDLQRIPGGPWRVLQATRHGNKLRRGHLAGNRFRIAIRGMDPGAPTAEILEQLRRRGFPNYFGPQRFGQRGDNGARGKSLLRGTESPAGGPERRKFLTNAYQAELFNRILAQRIARDADPGSILAGDLAVLHRNGASFPVDEAGLKEARRRAEAHEISASAPLFGYRVPLAAGLPGRWETALLERESLALADFRRGAKRGSVKGERRSVRALADDLTWERDAPHRDNGAGATLLLEFTLPPGVYATSLLREVTKSQEPASPTTR